ncbi:MAG: hypothetical protein IJU76_04880 [Desulfovibrionaceae bacterium]|nr:hypothetical protein [Desulfovibrionaceae bacterium]
MDDRIRLTRPKRRTLPDFDGRLRALSSGQSAWKCLRSGGESALLLGLGPDDAWPAVGSQVFWLEAPGLQQKLAQSPPSAWRKVTLEEALALFPNATVWLYEPGLQFAPDFWMHVLGSLFAASLPFRTTEQKTALLFGDASALLHIELLETLQRAGFTCVERLPDGWEKHPEHALAEACHDVTPTICLAVNGRGLDSQGRLFGLLRALSIPCAIWFVDNPWHVLSGIRLPWWKEADLFVTDASFVPLLRQEGAKSVHALPLAFAWHMWRSLRPDAGKEAPLFVGRTVFPGRDRYFAACHLPPTLLEEAKILLSERKILPDVHWWYNKLRPRFWPGTGARLSGLGAESCSLINKTQWIDALSLHGLRLVGDSGWSALLPGKLCEPSVDYYTVLPTYYAQSSCVLAVTSFLLPHSLSQRHFDVWAAGGFLLSDPTPGLAIFPEELTRPITLNSPMELRHMDSACIAAKETAGLQEAWRTCLWENHSYLNRWQTICSVCLNTERPVSQDPRLANEK